MISDIKSVVTPDGAASNTTIQNSINNQVRRSPQEQQNFQQLIRERDSLRDDLNSLENNYSELFKRYERMRENAASLKNVKCLILHVLNFAITTQFINLLERRCIERAY